MNISSTGTEVRSASDSRRRVSRCSVCHASFKRQSHLNRHVRLHSLEGNPYLCLCGQSFSRNDSFARHLKVCEKARDDSELTHKVQSVISRKQSRIKRACDSCARQKLKCNSQWPCERCTRRDTPCVYTRHGYVDVFEEFRVHQQDSDLGSAHDQQNLSPKEHQHSRSGVIPAIPTSQSLKDLDDQLEASPPRTTREANAPRSVLDAQLDEQNTVSAAITHCADPPLIDNFTMPNFYSIDAEIGISPLPADLIFTNLGPWANFNHAYPTISTPISSPMIQDMGQYASILGRETENCDISKDSYTFANFPNQTQDPFGLQQIDPLESTCSEMRQFLKGAMPITSSKDIDTYITRDKVSTCSRLFGRHILRNLPILHSPTFMLAQANPLLVLAIVVGGACYDRTMIPAEKVTRFADALVRLIEQQTHRSDKQDISVAVLQASLIGCLVLLCAPDNRARSLAAAHFARTIWLAESCGLFRRVEGTSDGATTAVKFDWAHWIEQETHRRLTGMIFCLDMAFRVFMLKGPLLSPLTCTIQLPSHEQSWEASSAKDCLRHLSSTPSQPTLLSCMRYLRNLDMTGFRQLGVSKFGMFIIIHGLNASLSRMIEEEEALDFSWAVRPGELLPRAADPGVSLHKLTAHNVADSADIAIHVGGSVPMKQLDLMLSLWKQIWDQLLQNDNQAKTASFPTNPLPFWYLAKLQQLSHMSGFTVQRDDELNFFTQRSVPERARLDVQGHIVYLLSHFREQSQEWTSHVLWETHGLGVDRHNSEANSLPLLIVPS